MIASVQLLACIVDLQGGLHLKGWQAENVSLRDRLFQFLYRVLLLGNIRGIGERRKQDTHNGQKNVLIHRVMVKQSNGKAKSRLRIVVVTRRYHALSRKAGLLIETRFFR